ncbi:MAG: FHIPEP family type III secretion protein [Phycisphaerae bacterium]|nr:FHIPEP family type III secretion protein [Phycisphaerae bacterium]
MSLSDRVNTLLVRFGDVILALAVVGMIAVLVVRVPPGVMDALFATNIGLSVLVLLVALSIPDAMRLPSFPAILLLTTLFRLALNVSSTRLILLDGYAGEVIQTFGRAVVGGSYIVGAVVFVVIVFVQFVVIAKGSERVAEVAARFTLDAMPGKQMAIDADLRAGLLTPEEARAARRTLERESKLYGAMDGAMKFVKGDAIAGVVIALVIMCGGFAIGVWQLGQPWNVALPKYALLTIGDGLAAQIPSILISIAAGLVVTRVAAENANAAPVAKDIAVQFLRHPGALLLTGVFLAVICLLPMGFPRVPFLALAGLSVSLGAAAWWNARREAAAPETITAVIGVGLAGSHAAAIGEVVTMLDASRRALESEYGVEIGPIGPRPGTAASYCIDLRGVPIAVGEIPDGSVVVEADAATVLAAGPAATALTAPWASRGACAIPESSAEAARAAGLNVLRVPQAAARHGEWSLRRKLHTFLTIQRVSAMVETLRTNRPDLVRAVTPQPLPLFRVVEVLRRLVREGVPVRDLEGIFESLARHGSSGHNAHGLTERVRRDLADALCAAFAQRPGMLSFYAADPELENLAGRGTEDTSEGQVVTLSHEEQRRIVDSVRRAIDPRRHASSPPVLVVSGASRRAVRTVIEDSLPEVAVLSYDELSRDVELERLGLVVLDEG